MFSTFSTALSALNADSAAIDVVGNNLANLNTVGYKGTAVSFRDLVAASMGAGNDVGIGVDKPLETRVFTQGNIQASSGLFDVAIRGGGFLVVKDTSLSQTYYTRAGNLQVDKAGLLRTASGDAVQGWAIDPATGDIAGNLGNLSIPVSTLTEPSATSKVSITANLDSTAATGATFSTTMPVYDSQGLAHNLKIVFTKSSTLNQWTYQVLVPKEDVSGATQDVDITPIKSAGPPVVYDNVISFGMDGKLPDPTGTPLASTDPPLQVALNFDNNAYQLTNGATLGDLQPGGSVGQLTWNTRDANDVGMLTQFSQASALSANSQDGQAPGQVLNFSIVDGGKIVAKVSNGPQRVVGMLALAAIQNPETLEAVGDNKYQLTDATALPAVGTAGTGGRGQIAAAALESSTVDIAAEFTNLIVYQRGYQANSKIITTLDELSQDTINLKR